MMTFVQPDHADDCTCAGCDPGRLGFRLPAGTRGTASMPEDDGTLAALLLVFFALYAAELGAIPASPLLPES